MRSDNMYMLTYIKYRSPTQKREDDRTHMCTRDLRGWEGGTYLCLIQIHGQGGRNGRTAGSTWGPNTTGEPYCITLRHSPKSDALH